MILLLILFVACYILILIERIGVFTITVSAVNETEKSKQNSFVQADDQKLTRKQKTENNRIPVFYPSSFSFRFSYEEKE